MSTIAGSPCAPPGTATYLQLIAHERCDAEALLEPKAGTQPDKTESGGLQPLLNSRILAVVTAAKKSGLSGFQNADQHRHPVVQPYASNGRQLQADAVTQPGEIFDGYA